MQIMIKRTFQDQWFGEFAWLSYTSGNDTMTCNVCRKFTRLSDPKSALVLGTNKFRKDPLYKHEKSTCHIACVNHQCYLDLMSICVDGPSLEDFDATESINVWLMERTGTRHLDGHQPKRTASVSAVDSAPPSTPAPLETV